MAHTIGVQDVSSFGIVLSRFRNLAAYTQINDIFVLNLDLIMLWNQNAQYELCVISIWLFEKLQLINMNHNNKLPLPITKPKAIENINY